MSLRIRMPQAGRLQVAATHTRSLPSQANCQPTEVGFVWLLLRFQSPESTNQQILVTLG